MPRAMPGTRHRTSPTTLRTISATRRTRRPTPRTTPAPPPPDGLLALRPTDERGCVAACVRSREALLVEGPDPVEKVELVAEVRPHHLGPVGGDRERHLVLDEPGERLQHQHIAR